MPEPRDRSRDNDPRPVYLGGEDPDVSWRAVRHDPAPSSSGAAAGSGGPGSGSGDVDQSAAQTGTEPVSPSGAESADYTSAELEAARRDWSDFNSPRLHGQVRQAMLQEAGGRSISAGPDAAAPAEGLADRTVSRAAREAQTARTRSADAAAGHERSPETAAIPIPSMEQRQWHRTIRELEHRLLGAERTLTYREMARQLGVSTRSARRLWRALGFPNLDDDVKAFTQADVEALATMIELVRDQHLNEETAISLTRSVGQMTDRMVVWQIEALVEDKIANDQLSDAVARTQVVETLPKLIEPIQKLMGYTWRRQLSAALQRLTVRVESGLAASAHGRTGEENDSALPLARAVGFADLVSYTSLSRQMNERTLAHMVQHFESKCAEIISIGGGRLVKTVGDEVLYNAETPEAGAEIALALAESIAADGVLPEARVSVVWGRVLSRMGDIYGPTVNLAARLTSLADPGTILVDQVTAQTLETNPDYLLVPQPPRIVRGFGEVQPNMLLRGQGAGMERD
ncbi:adenylate cyclase [Nesterenkonia lutea]|uniref:Adenylate cyclase n=2 Tax=Nesterenkonia lutea TaxID=272919 RepID=A0ABR9JBE3_9MICC|nr:adenylate cyclase [Nesterenkonia lutea]